MVRIKLSKQLRIKIILHAFQAFFIAIAIVLTLSVLAKAGPTNGRTVFAIALSFLTLLPLIYLACTPQWQRTRRFSNGIAFIVLDALLAVFWFAATIAVGTWNSEGTKKGADDRRKANPDEKVDAGCSTFAYGSYSRCATSKASVAFLIIVCMLFIGTTALSVMIWRSGELNESISHAPLAGNEVEWSTEMELQSDGQIGSGYDDDTGAEKLTGPSRPYVGGNTHIYTDSSDSPLDHKPSSGDLGVGGYEKPVSPSGYPTATSPGPPTLPMPGGFSSTAYNPPSGQSYQFS